MGRYVAEFSDWHNDKEADTIDQTTRMAAGMATKRLRYCDLATG